MENWKEGGMQPAIYILCRQEEERIPENTISWSIKQPGWPMHIYDTCYSGKCYMKERNIYHHGVTTSTYGNPLKVEKEEEEEENIRKTSAEEEE